MDIKHSDNYEYNQNHNNTPIVLSTMNSDSLNSFDILDRAINNLSTQNQQWRPRVLVLGPGGVKGLKILGFLSPLEDSEILEYTDTYCGVSIGSIISLLIVCGYKIREIVGEATKLDIFKDLDFFDINLIMTNTGLISNEPLKRKLTKLVVDKLGNVPTLYNLYIRTGKSFTAVTYNATDELPEMKGPFTDQNMSCVDAVMFSMNIPFFFYQLIHRGKTYVDGALGNPYPIDYFDDGKTNILGIYLKTIHSKLNTPITPIPSTIIQKIDNTSIPIPLRTYLLKIIYALMDQRRNQIIHQSSDRCKHICLETKTTDTVGYNVTTDDKAHMLVEGFNEGKIFLRQLQDNTYKGPKIPERLRYTYPTYYMMGESDNTNDTPDNEIINILPAMHN